jgi:hypothetical protein
LALSLIVPGNKVSLVDTDSHTPPEVTVAVKGTFAVVLLSKTFC